MGLKAVEDRPTPKEVYNWRVYSASLLISFGALLFGYDSAFLGTTIARKGFKDAFGITAMSPSQQAATSSNITATFQAAAFFGALFSWLIMERIGRKFTLQLSAIIFNIGAVLMTAATSQLSLVYAGRALTGLATGGITAVVPCFIAEISPPAIRGILTGFFEIMYQIGSVVGFWINYGITETISPTAAIAYRIPMAVQLIPGGMLMIGCFFLKESPQLLIRRGKVQQGVEILCYLRKLPADDIYILEELDMISKRIEEERMVAGRDGPSIWAYIKGAFRELALPGMRNRVLLVFIMFLLQNSSGAAAINYYSPTLFKSIGITDVALYTGIYGLVKAVASIIFYLFLIDKVGRRVPTIVSGLGCAACLAFVGAYVKIGNPAGHVQLSASQKAGGKAATAMLMLYSAFWSFGLNGIPWIVSAEIFPIRLRSLTGAYAAMCQWLAQFYITKALPQMFLAMNYGVWFFFVGCLVLSAVWAFFFLPETKGVPISEMDVIFGFEKRPHHGIPHHSTTGTHALDAARTRELEKDKDSFQEVV